MAIGFALQQAPEQLGSQAEAAKGALASSIESQKASISARIERARGQARGDAAAARSEVLAQAESFIAEVEAQTSAAIESLTATHGETMGAVVDLETTTLDTINQVYATGRTDLEGLGTIVGDECTAVGNTFAATYRGFRHCTENGFWDGDLSERRSMAQENAAHSTAKGFHDRLIESARTRAKEITKAGRKKDRCSVIAAGASARDTLDSQLAALTTAPQTASDGAIEQAGSARDALASSINSSPGSTPRQPDAQEHDQRQAADDAGFTQHVLRGADLPVLMAH